MTIWTILDRARHLFPDPLRAPFTASCKGVEVSPALAISGNKPVVACAIKNRPDVPNRDGRATGAQRFYDLSRRYTLLLLNTLLRFKSEQNPSRNPGGSRGFAPIPSFPAAFHLNDYIPLYSGNIE